MTTLVGDQLYLWLEPVLLPVNVNIGVADDKNRIELQLGVMDKSSIQNLLSIRCQPAVGSSSGFNVTFLRDWSNKIFQSWCQ